ncbi:hypothetical protein AG1IA_00530 [Rhizoctonia solani AG-1 IA]|uniref:Uncharacterized protein n=1 Tax=Thanatephorus cucumeris (strain AG1-IA) TaxID=983506 RepID=L8X549_THACA|nr:hypothetical protein AG1IA_00530 [Rhizoctonia solani AG-1 IA]
MSGALLSTAFGAMQIVYTAYRDTKSNKEKCASLVQRAEFVVEELKVRVGSSTGDLMYHTEPLKQQHRCDVQSNNCTNAYPDIIEPQQTIHEVGHKNWLKALLDADRDAIHVEHFSSGPSRLEKYSINVPHRMKMSGPGRLTTRAYFKWPNPYKASCLHKSPTFGSPVYSTNQDHRSAGSPSSRPIAQECQPVAKEPGFSGKAKGGASTAVPQIQRRKSWMNKIGLQMIPVVRIPMPGIRAIPSNKARMMAKSHTKIAPDAGDEAGDEVFPECDRQWELGQFEKPQSTSPVVQLDHMQKVRYESRYVEVRYYPRDLACGVLLSEAFSKFGTNPNRSYILTENIPS